MNTLSISTHHCDDLKDAYKGYDFTGVDVVTVGPASSLWATFAQSPTLTAKVVLSENRDGFGAAGCFANCTGLTEWPKTDTGRTRDVTATQGMFRGCSNVSGFMPWKCAPVTCQRMFHGCKSWDGHGVNLLSFENTVHPNSMLEMFTDVPLTTQNLGFLLDRIEDTLPADAVRYGVDVGCGHADALCMLRMSELPGVEFVHTGTQEQWDFDFDDQAWGYIECTEDVYLEPALDFSTFKGLDGHFVSPYNGCLVARQWGVFANHFMPPVGFEVVTRTGERLRVADRVRGPGDLCLVRFAEPAKTEPVTVLDTDAIHEFFGRDRYCEHVAGSGIPCYMFDRFEAPRLFEFYWVNQDTKGISVGPAVHLAGGIHNRSLTTGDSGSIGFVVNQDRLALATHEVFSAGGGGTSIGACREWIEGVMGEPLKMGV